MGKKKKGRKDTTDLASSSSQPLTATESGATGPPPEDATMSSAWPKTAAGGVTLDFLPRAVRATKPALKKAPRPHLPQPPLHHRSTLSVHFADMSGRALDTIGRHGSVGPTGLQQQQQQQLARTNSSDGEGSVGSLSDDHVSDTELARGPRFSLSSAASSLSSSSSSFSSASRPLGQDLDVEAEGEEGEEDEEEEKSLKHMDLLGVALENTFKEVESIDTYVQKLREDFDHELMNEHTFITHICTARMARAACCKRQLSVWQHLQHELIDYCCHFHHIHDHDDLSNHSDDLNRNHNGHDSSSQESEMEALIGSLNRMPTFDLVKKRLEPEGDSRSFVSHWILHGEDALGHQHFSEANNNDTDSDSSH